MKRAGLFWLAFLSAFAALDVWADRNDVPDDTFSEQTRSLFRTHTPKGYLGFMAAWTGVYVGYALHIKYPRQPKGGRAS